LPNKRAIEEIAATPGLDGIYIGPADLALGLGLTPGTDAAEHDEGIARIREACHAHGLIAGMHCGGGRAAHARADEGFQMVTVGVDASLFQAAISRELAEAREQ